ncbi:NAD(P)H-dependent oxidoreductase [Helicobacter aurati]|uniref:NAD(P)H-dependent oxidoreductase n=1 Tax=Helicobacter aurati TaxID=137778 RepID=A0A3D8J7E9_9HELI|nr:NAD(P)H-dependent oxidoreductase [Helicobacter aurati]RDU73342.1 NAD(P)H-dependent oxidoreductase [Helicobacter aurati]
MRFLDNDKILESCNFRHACKSFDSTQKIAEHDFMTILESARLSPSSFGLEPWKFLVIRDMSLRDKIYHNAWGGQDSLKNGSEFIIILARKHIDLYPNSEYVWHIMRNVHNIREEGCKLRSEFYERFQKDDFAIYNDEQRIFDWACKQCYIALANMMNTAALLGIDSLPIEGFHQKHIEHILKEEKNIDSKHFGVAVMVAFGYRLKEPKHSKTRQALEDIVQFL